VTSQLQQLQATKPQALFMQGFGSPVGVILSSRAKLGWTIPTIGDLTASTTPLISTLAGTNQEKNVSVQILQLEKYQAIQPKGTLAYIGHSRPSPRSPRFSPPRRTSTTR